MPNATGTTINPHALSVEDLMTRGYFPDRAIPPINSLALAPAMPDILSHVRPLALDLVNKVKGASIPRSRCVSHSIPKRKHLRRTLSIPNPLAQAILCDEVALHWQELSESCAKSPISLSIPKPSVERAIEVSNDIAQLPSYRARQSVGARYLLTSDIARYYPSIYTHSIPWALHTKSTARDDKKNALVGN